MRPEYRSHAPVFTIFRTDQDGAITITSDGKKYSYRTAADTFPQDLNADRRFLEMWEAM